MDKGWWKKYSRQEKMMAVIIVLLLVCIFLRWGSIRKEAGDAFKYRIERIKGNNPDSL